MVNGHRFSFWFKIIKCEIARGFLQNCRFLQIAGMGQLGIVIYNPSARQWEDCGFL